MSRTCLALSPHLDDAAFSCGGLLADLADRGWRVVMATVFTRSVVPAQGFALACQLDKGLAPDVDYMALRRAEDADAAAILGVEPRWLDLLEAPHRGYDSAPALFGPYAAADTVAPDVARVLTTLRDELRPELVLAPQGLGNHADHRRVIDAALAVFDPARLGFYRDTPYAIRQPGAPAYAPPGRETVVPLSAALLERRVAASLAYRSQIGFQFGGPAPAAAALRAFVAAEGGERFCGAPIMVAA